MTSFCHMLQTKIQLNHVGHYSSETGQDERVFIKNNCYVLNFNWALIGILFQI